MKKQNDEVLQLFCPRHYRVFVRWSDRFIRVVPWLFLSGVGACVAVPAFQLEAKWGVSLGLVCAITAWPAVIGWIVVSGCGLVWRVLLDLGRARAEERKCWGFRFGFFLFIGLALLGYGAIMLFGLLA